MAQASLSTGSRSHLLPAVVGNCSMRYPTSCIPAVVAMRN